LVLSYGLRLTVIGLVLGVAAALAVSRVISSQLFVVKATDPMTFLVTPVALAVVALLASYLPSYRAAKLEPMTALRHEGQ
jgi:ABC-type lipoprotein release transport system permease subunit